MGCTLGLVDLALVSLVRDRSLDAGASWRDELLLPLPLLLRLLMGVMPVRVKAACPMVRVVRGHEGGRGRGYR